MVTFRLILVWSMVLLQSIFIVKNSFLSERFVCDLIGLILISNNLHNTTISNAQIDKTMHCQVYVCYRNQTYNVCKEIIIINYKIWEFKILSLIFTLKLQRKKEKDKNIDGLKRVNFEKLNPICKMFSMYGHININKPGIYLYFGFSIPEFRYPHKERLCIRNKNVIFYKTEKIFHAKYI